MHIRIGADAYKFIHINLHTGRTRIDVHTPREICGENRTGFSRTHATTIRSGVLSGRKTI